MPRIRIGKGKLTDTQKEALALLYLEEPESEYVRSITWNTLEKKNFVYFDEDGKPELTPFGVNVAKMIIGEPLQ